MRVNVLRIREVISPGKEQSHQIEHGPLWRMWRLRFYDMNADHVLNHFQIRKPPIPVRDIVLKCGIKIVSLDESEKVSGLANVADDNSTAEIGIKTGDSQARQRFTLAHELGHVLLHREQLSFRDEQFSRHSHAEIEANNFAAELLMPSWLIWPLVDADKTPEAISAIFQVSRVAAEYRLLRLGTSL